MQPQLTSWLRNQKDVGLFLSSVGPVKQLLRKRSVNQLEAKVSLYEASMGRGNKSLFVVPGSIHDQGHMATTPAW